MRCSSYSSGNAPAPEDFVVEGADVEFCNERFLRPFPQLLPRINRKARPGFLMAFSPRIRKRGFQVCIYRSQQIHMTLPSEMPQEGPRYRALVVEDDAAIRRLVEKVLSRHSIETESVTDGTSAVEKLRTGHYSVLVLDLMVPGLDGFEVIEFLRREAKNVPVAVVSAVSQQALSRLDPDIVKLVITKPFDVGELTRGVLALCRGQRSGIED